MTLNNIPLPRIKYNFSGIIGLLFFCFIYSIVDAHDIPISEIRIVPGESQLHLELKLNVFELKFISEIDTNNNGYIDEGEFEEKREIIKKHLLRSLKIEIGGVKADAKTSGVMLDANSHHLIFRAHYPVDSRTEYLKLTSELQAITSQAQVTLVTYGSYANQQLAKLEARSNSVLFNPVITRMSNGVLASYFNKGGVILIIGFGLVVVGVLTYELKRSAFFKK